MTRFLIPLFALSVLLLSSCSEAPSDSQNEYSFNRDAVTVEESALMFTVMGNQGTIDTTSMKWTLDAANPTNLEQAKLEMIADMTKLEVEAENAELASTITGENFFDSKNHARIEFRSLQIVHNNEDTYTVIGDLMLKDVINRVQFKGEITNDSMVLKSQISRNAYSLGDETFGEDLIDVAIQAEFD